MTISNNPPKVPYQFLASKIEGKTVILTPLSGKEQVAALRAFSQNPATSNFAYTKDGVLILSKDLYSSERTYVISEVGGEKTSLTGRVRVMNESDVAEIKAFAAQYFARIKEKEEAKSGKVSEQHNWQPVRESDKKKGDVARRAIANANEREEEARGKENLHVESRANLETSKRIERFYDKMKHRSVELEEFHKQTRDNKIN